MKKAEFLAYWNSIPDEGPTPDEVMEAIPYKHEGSTFAQDGIRLTGSPEFIRSMLRVLRPLLNCNNATERLSVVYKESTDNVHGMPLGSWNCYIQVHERGREAKHLNLAYGRGKILSGG